MSVECGTVTAIIGPSGAGKTSLLRALSLVDPPSEGRIVIDGDSYDFPDARHRVPTNIWPKVTLVFQQLFLWPHLSIWENIRLPLAKNADGRLEFAQHLIDIFSLDDCLTRLPYEASIGQRQRAAIVRAMALKPKYLLLDEVTSALDVEHVHKLGSVLADASEGGTAVVIVTHLLGFARKTSHQYLFLEQGKCIETGKIGDLDKSPQDRVRRFIAIA